MTDDEGNIGPISTLTVVICTAHRNGTLSTYSKHQIWHLSCRIEYPVEESGVMVLGWRDPWGWAVGRLTCVDSLADVGTLR